MSVKAYAVFPGKIKNLQFLQEKIARTVRESNLKTFIKQFFCC